MSVKFYIAEWHDAEYQTGERREFMVKSEAVACARAANNPDSSWYCRPRVYSVQVDPTTRNVAALTAGRVRGRWTLVYDGEEEGEEEVEEE